MKDLLFFYKDTGIVTNSEIVKIAPKLKEELKLMNKAALDRYEGPRASIHAPFDKFTIEEVKRTISSKLKLKPDYLIVVGIGGSNLGTIAVQEAVLGKMHNTTSKIKILFADTVDSVKIERIVKLMQQEIKKGKKFVLNCVTKSGGTTETIANFEVLLDAMKKQTNYSDYVVVTTMAKTKLWELATKKGFTTLEHQENIGGRYSVFSTVGLFPLGMIGVNLKDLLKGARTMRARCLQTKWQDNPAAASALLRFVHSKKGKNINDMFLFRTDLESVGKWYRQLMGESIGKEYNIKKKKVNNGITPTFSVGSTDLHSMAQLYLGGPYDKLTHFISVESGSSLKIPSQKEFDKLVPHIQGKKFDAVMDAILKGVKTAFKKGKRAYAEIMISDTSENSIGQLLQFFMMEMMYLGVLMDVNPFDQPNVEAYKIETKKILARAK